MTDVADDPNPDAELDLRDAVEVARTIADLVKRVRDLETRQQLGSSTTSDTDDPDAPTVADVADLAQTATFDIAGLSEALEGLDTALTQNAEDVRIASIAAEAAGEAGTSAAQLANEAADDALAKADEAKAAADDALEAAANAGGGNAYENRAPTSADQADPDTGRPFRDAALWFVRATNTGIVTGAYQYAQPDPSQPGTWAQITLSNEVLGQLDAGKINTGFLSAERIEAESITGAKIATDTLTSRVIAADAITAAELAADAVLARSIKAGEIQTGHLAALLIDASKIQAGAVIAEKIAAGAVTADSIAAGAITATKLSADAINGKTITGVTITGGLVTGTTVQTSATGKRVVLSNNRVNFYGLDGSAAVTAGIIEGVPNGAGGGLISIGSGTGGDVFLQLGNQSLPTSGSATMRSYGVAWFDDVYAGGTVTGRYLRAAGTGDVSPTSVGHGFEITANDGSNLRMDNNEIMAVMANGSPNSLYIQADGGNIGLGDNTSIINLPGRLNATHLLYASASGQTTTSGAIGAGSAGSRGISFPAGRFTVPPYVFAISENGRLTIGAQSISTSGATLSINNWSNGSAPAGAVVNWWAIQQSAGSANG